MDDGIFASVKLHVLLSVSTRNIGEIHYHEKNKTNGGKQIEFSTESNQLGKKHQKWE